MVGFVLASGSTAADAVNVTGRRVPETEESIWSAGGTYYRRQGRQVGVWGLRVHGDTDSDQGTRGRAQRRRVRIALVVFAAGVAAPGRAGRSLLPRPESDAFVFERAAFVAGTAFEPFTVSIRDTVR